MRIYMVTDIEGVSGVTKWNECKPADRGRYEQGEWRYMRSRRLLTAEINAACEGAFSAGAREIVVWDGHGSKGIDIENLHPRARLLTGTGRMGKSRALGMDLGFDGVFFVGQHAMNRTEAANLCHTGSSLSISNSWVNEMLVGEFGLRTVLAGYFDIPVLLLTGDDKACMEARNMVPDIETAQVKESYGREYALCLSPERAREEIREAAARAVKKAGEIKPFKMKGPSYELKWEFYDLSRCKEGDRSFDRPVREPQVLGKSDDFFEAYRMAKDREG